MQFAVRGGGSKESIGIKRNRKESKGIERNRKESIGIEKNQQESKGINTVVGLVPIKGNKGNEALEPKK